MPTIKLSKYAILKNNYEATAKNDYAMYQKEFAHLQISNTSVATTSSIPILLYHGVLRSDQKEQLKLSPEDISLDLFKRQLVALKQNGYKTITLEQFINFLEGKTTLPDKSFIISFDDGEKSSYYNTDPLLHALDFSAVMYVITGHSVTSKHSPYYLDLDELKNMRDSNRWSLQSHGRDDHTPVPIDAKGTLGRFMTNKKWLTHEKRLETQSEYEQRIYQDMVNSKKDLEDALHITVDTYAFPNGDYGKDDTAKTVLGIVGKVYQYTFIQFRPDQNTGYYRNDYINQNDLLLRRVKVNETVSVTNLLNDLKAGKEKTLPYTAIFEKNYSDWVSNTNDNTYHMENGKMMLETTKTNHNLTVFLDGTYLWRNFEYSATVKTESGKSVGLIARAKSGKDFYMCVFKQNSIQLEEHVDGERVLIHDTLKQFQFDLIDTKNVGIRVNGDIVSCLVNKKVTVRSYKIKHLISNGGIGINVVDDKKKPATIEIENLQIIPL